MSTLHTVLLIIKNRRFENEFDNINYLCFARLPVPAAPSLQGSVSLLGSAFAMAIVSFAISISMAQLFAKKHNYDIDANQVSLGLLQNLSNHL